MQDKKLYELTNPQKSIWYTEEVFKGTTINNICTSAMIFEDVDVELLKRAINLVVNKNDSFRIHVVSKNEQVYQYISDCKYFDIDIAYINIPSELEKIEAEEANHSFDIIDSDLFKFKIVVLKDVFTCIILTVNHIIADSWSLGITIQEILRNYNCLKNNKISDVKSSSYIDFINSEKEYKQSEKYEKDKAYWSKIFDTIPEQATIPGAKKISDKNSTANNKSDQSLANISAKRLGFNINKKLVDRITNYCKENHFSTFNFLMAIYSIYISRVSNVNDFVIGTPILNRTNNKEKHSTGMMVNTAPVRINSIGTSPFKDLVNSFSKKMMGILRHQKYSYNSILDDLRAKHGNIPNLYNILISYQVTKAFDKNFGHYTTNWNFNNYCANDLNIHISDINNTGNLLINYDYLTSKYTSKDIQDFHKRIIYMINQVLKNNEILSSEIEIVTEQEKNRILNEFNDTAANYPKDKTIVDLFEEQVQKTPDNIAVVFEDKSFTYKELNEKANSLARSLVDMGVKPRDIVGLRIDKSLEMVIGILAIIKTGSCYLPINMQYPKERIEFMLSNTKSKLLLGTPASLNEYNLDADVEKLDISLSNTKLYSNKTGNLNIKILPEDLIYIIYTSGTTGTPKGAMLMHKNVVRLMKNDKFLFDFNEKDVWPLFHSVAFDVSVWEMYGAFLYGGKLVVVPDNVAKDPNMFLSLIDKENVTILCQTPTYFYNLSNCEVKAPHTNLKVRYIIFAGEALKTNLLMPWHELHPSTKLINMYGITEITVHGTFKELSEDELKLPSSDIGVPLPTLKMLVLDQNQRLLPYGVPGEICVAGDGVFKGYLNRPELNEKKLVPNPYNPSEILYRSADLAVLTANHKLDFLGRIDTQVKIRGFRVELSEIEEKIHEFPNVKSCIVINKDADGMHDILCAYYIAKAQINISELRKKLQHDLPEYMIPQYFVEVKEWPYNVNGKIDKKRLPEPQFNISNEEIVLPRNDVDTKLVEILKHLLNINEVSIENSFFNIGGDSLTAINLCMEIENIFNFKVYVKDILENPIIKDLSDLIAKNVKPIKEHKIPKLKNAEYYPISSAQKRIYFASQAADSSSTLYNISGGVLIEASNVEHTAQVDGNLTSKSANISENSDISIDVGKLQKCFQTVINRHESLRTYFEVIDGKVVQKIMEPSKTLEASLNNTTVEDSINNSITKGAKNSINFKLDYTENAKFEDLQEIFKSFVKPFDLSKAPLFRAKLVSFTNGKYALLVDMHHIISDGTSLAILTDEISNLYNDKSLPELKTTYKDFANYEKEMLSAGLLNDAENYWVDQFKGEIPILNMPTSYPRPAVKSYDGKKVYCSINANTRVKIELLSTKLGITPYMLLLACYYVLLSKYTSQEDIVIGSPIIGRNISEVSNIIGMFVNTLALRNTVNSATSFTDFAKSLKENLLESYKYQAYPFDELVNKLNIKRDTSRSPLFDTMFIYQNNGYKDLSLNGIKSKYFIPDTNISKFDLSLEIIPKDNEMSVSFEYATSLFEEDFIKHLSEHYLNILNNVLENSDAKISEINMLSEQEKNKILYEFNNTKLDYPKDKTIVDLFEEQVEKTPDNIAVVFENKKLTYRELNEKANSLAYYLRTNHNIDKNNLVGIMVNRSLEMMISILAVLKAGGAYIPIDPTYPKDRIDYMLSSSSAKILLTQNKLDKKVNFSNKTFIDLDNKDIYNCCNNNLEHINGPEDLAYIIYTSGSTGKPKGVMLKHKSLSNLTNYCNNYVEYLKNPSNIGVVSITTVSFDIFIFETLVSLQKGLKLVIANESEQNMPNLLNNLIKENDVKVIQSTPSRMQQFINNLSYIPELKNLEYITLAGEQLPLSLLNTLHELSNAIVYNGYGPSETTVFSTFTQMEHDKVSIGKPLANTQIYILDNNLKPVPIGVPGEIYISGDGVGKGYINNKDLTAKYFIQNPFIQGSLMYKTGDMGMYNKDGIITCLGRLDNQIKIRGLRIELEEIESLLLKYPHITKACVIKQTLNNREFISAYYTVNKRINVNELRNYLSSLLPRYMVPSYFVDLDKFPYTPNGKIDKKSLPLPKELLTISKEDYVAPKTELQRNLVNIWEKILNTKPIGINDNFFELGGDSLLAMNLSVEILKISNKIKYSDIFRYPTISELEEKINTADDTPLFSKIENLSGNFTEILKNCTKSAKTKRLRNRNVLLTGSTGFLGIHTLEQFIKKTKGNVYCIIREEPGITAKTKLYQKLNYYFGNKYDNLLDNRIFAITGDITKPAFGLKQDDLLKITNSVDVVINCAANVSHFGNYNEFYNTNVKSVKYLIDFCNSFNKTLYHISTMSVSGTKLDASYPSFSKQSTIKFNESSLYIGQTLENVYVRSKFEAECYVLDAVSKGLDGYILRMGNLMPRFRDGFFQENLSSNAFVNKIIEFLKVGAIPEYMLDEPLEFTPIDYASNAVYRLVTHPNSTNRIFHIYNHKYILTEKLFNICKKYYPNLEILSEEDFKEKIKTILEKDNSKDILSHLLNDFDKNLHLDYKFDILIKSDFTVNYLRKTFFRWPRITNKYLIKFINLLRKVI